MLLEKHYIYIEFQQSERANAAARVCEQENGARSGTEHWVEKCTKIQAQRSKYGHCACSRSQSSKHISQHLHRTTTFRELNELNVCASKSLIRSFGVCSLSRVDAFLNLTRVCVNIRQEKKFFFSYKFLLNNY